MPDLAAYRSGRTEQAAARPAFGIPNAPTFPRATTSTGDSPVTNSAPVPGQSDPMAMPPIPLLTGQTADGVDGSTQQITGVEVCVTTADGHVTRIPLRSQHGAWWAPLPQ